MALMLIAIDTSFGARYSCTVFGFEREINKLHSEISSAMYGREKCYLHWSKTSKKIRKKARKEIGDSIRRSRVQFYIFEHKKPQGVRRKEYFLTYVPNSISSHIHTKLMGKFGVVIVEADRDFEIKNISNATMKFVQNFLFQICFKLVGKPVTIRRENQVLKATVKFPNQNKLGFVGRINTSRNSKAIQLADIALGYYLSKKGFEKMFFRKI